MSLKRNRRVFALAGSFVLALTLFVMLVPAGNAVDPPSAGPTIDAGQLKLHLSTDGHQYSYVDSGGATVATQPISQGSRCAYDSSPQNLVAVSSTGGTRGFTTSNNQIGVDSRDGSAKCTQVNSSESLTLDLTNDAGSMNGLYATYATLDVERKFDPLVTVSAYKDGNPVPVWTERYDCTTSDCGPDRDSVGDNAYIRFPKVGTILFDSIKIEATPTGTSLSAGVSLEGGNDLYLDGTRKDSIFYMAQPAEGSICPGQTVHEPTGTGTVDVTYLGTTGDCKDYLLTYTRDPATNDRDLSYLTSGSGAATFEVNIFAWDPEPVTSPVPATLVDPPLPSHPAQWCDGTASSPTMPSTPGEVWCLISQSTSTYGPDGDGTPGNPDWVPGYSGQLMQVTEAYLLAADAGCHR